MPTSPITVISTDFVSYQPDGNRRPLSGYAKFSDGRYFSWQFDVEHIDGRYQRVEKITFSTYKKLSLGGTTMAFKSAKREAALLAFFNS